MLYAFKANFLDGSFRGFRWLLGFGFEFDCQPKPKQWIQIWVLNVWDIIWEMIGMKYLEIPL